MLAKTYRLKRRQDFRRIYSRGKSVAVPCFVLYYRKNKSQGLRIGFSVSKKLGKAVQRNLVKRRCREAARAQLATFPRGYDYVFIVRQAATQADYQRLQNQMAKVLQRMRENIGHTSNGWV